MICHDKLPILLKKTFLKMHHQRSSEMSLMNSSLKLIVTIIKLTAHIYRLFSYQFPKVQKPVADDEVLLTASYNHVLP